MPASTLFTEIEKSGSGNYRGLARNISLVEAEANGWQEYLAALEPADTPVIGITGPPGAGKSSLTDALLAYLGREQHKVGVLCVDPSSPFKGGALLADRFRMQRWYTNPNVFIRSVSSRGALGGVHPRTLEVVELMKTAGFDYILVETVGVGQSEVEIAALADCTILVLVPESGDDIQAMKSGIMEAADIIVVNKKDRPGADAMVQQIVASQAFMPRSVPVLKTMATNTEGIGELMQAIRQQLNAHDDSLKQQILAGKAWRMLAENCMRGYNYEAILRRLQLAMQSPGFNLYRFVQSVENERAVQ